MSGPKIIIVDPSLIDVRGHHYQSVLDLVRALSPATPTLVTHAHFDRGLLPSSLPAHALFHQTVYDEPGIGARPDGRLARRAWKMKRALRHLAHDVPALARRAAGLPASKREPARWPELAAVVEATGMSAADHVVLPSAEPYLALELADILGRARPGAGPTIHARSFSVPTGAAAAGFGLMFARLAAEADLAARLHIYAETPAMARYLEQAFGAKTELFPYLIAGFAPLERQGRPVPARGLVFGYLGGARNEKGFPRLPAILRRVASDARASTLRPAFLLQVGSRNAKTDQLADLKAAVAGLDLDIDYHEGGATPEEYADLLGRCDALLLPYASDRYRISGSGILCEALIHAKPFVFTDGLSFGDFAIAGNGLAASDDTSFADAIMTIADGPGRFFDAAREARESYARLVADSALLRRLRTSAL